jgi:hypothetical protein
MIDQMWPLSLEEEQALEVPVGNDSQFVHSLAAHQFLSFEPL